MAKVLGVNRKPYHAEMHIKDLILDRQVQMRTALNRIAIIDYAEAMDRGDKFPPPVVFWIPGQKRFVADGFHRILAYKRNGVKTVRCQIRCGTKRDAILYAAGCNRTHGVRRTNEDKRKAVLTFLGDKEWCKWADTVIARHAGVAAGTVTKYRAWLGESAKGFQGEDGKERRQHERNGKIVFAEAHKSSNGVPDLMEEQIRGERCPYCGQKMKQGHGPRARGYKSSQK